MKKRLLVFEASFPNRYGNWHAREVLSLLATGNVDVHVTRFEQFAGVDFTVDVEVMHRFVPSSLQLYFLILNPKFNFLQAENPNGFDGTRWNGSYPGDYIVATRPEFSLTNYDRVYAIFLSQLNRIEKQFGQALDHTRKFVHLYGGGGFNPRSELRIDPAVTAICNHPKSSEAFRLAGGTAFDVWGGPTMFRHESAEERSPRGSEEELGVAFSMIGKPLEKGLAQYRRIAFLYRLLYPSDLVKFHFVGKASYKEELPDWVELHEPMAFWELDDFYRKKVHVYLSLTTKRAFNGWPMGIEAMKHGVPVLSTDPHRQRDLIPDRGGATFHRLSLGFVLHIRAMYKKPTEWTRQSRRATHFIRVYCTYEAQQQRILGILGEKEA